MPDPQKFARLNNPGRIWGIGAIHGDADRLKELHGRIGSRFRPGDRLVYLGNMIGRGPQVRATIDGILDFRRTLLAMRGVIATDIVYLRGRQEEMWQKLLQLQFAPNPAEVLSWMLQQGVEPTLAAYGGDSARGLAAARDGAVTLARWTGHLRTAQRAAPGHDNLFSALRRAAFTNGPDAQPKGVLFVSSGLDPHRPLGAQGDSFWWGGSGFERIDRPYGEFRRMIRGHDPACGGLAFGPHTITLDAGCGMGGHLACAVFTPDGEVVELIEV